MRLDAHDSQAASQMKHAGSSTPEELLSTVVSICEKHLGRGKIHSYRDARLQYFHLKALTLSVLICKSIAPAQTEHTTDALHYLMAMGMLGQNTLAFYLANADELEEALAPLAAHEVPASMRLGDLYQGLLELDLKRAEDGAYHLMPAKDTRDTIGSYYTRPDLAWEVTRKALDSFVERKTGLKDYSWSGCTGDARDQVSKLLSVTRTVDLSCGAGEFMCAAMRYAKTFSDAAESFAWGLMGFDVDPIALAICCRELILEGGFQDSVAAQRRISNQLVLGNPLYIAESESSFDLKATLFALGRPYAAGMAVSHDTLAGPEGFTVVLGNPPWEKTRFEERRFFAPISPEIATEPNKTARNALVAELEQNEPDLHLYREQIASDYAAVRQVVASNPYLKQIPAGELNTYALFLALGLALLDRGGILALVLKSAVVTSPVNSALFSDVRRYGLREVHLFDNRHRIFPIDSREKFCVLIVSNHPAETFQVSFGNKTVQPLRFAEMATVTAEILDRINPETHTLPTVNCRDEFEMLASVSGHLPSFGEVFPDCRFGRLLHLTSHASHIHREPQQDRIPVLEGKLFGQHDLRYATFAGVPEELRYVSKARARRLTPAEKMDETPMPRYYVDADFWRKLSSRYREKYMVCWRSLTSATNSRTMIASISAFQPAIQSVQFLQTPDPSDLVLIAGLFNSTIFDSLIRLKIPGIDLTQSVIRQVPVPDRTSWSKRVHFGGERKSIRSHIEKRVTELYSNEQSLAPLFTLVCDATDTACLSDATQLMNEIDSLVQMAYSA